MAQQPILPDPYEVEELYYIVFSHTDTKPLIKPVGRLNMPLTNYVKKALRTVTLSQHKTRIKVKHQNTQQITLISDTRDHDHFIEFGGKIKSYNPNKKVMKLQYNRSITTGSYNPESNLNHTNNLQAMGLASDESDQYPLQEFRDKIRRENINPNIEASNNYEPFNTVSYNSDNGNNHAWMADLQPYIGNRLLSEIALPGTHDSGMYDCAGLGCGGTAVTQKGRTITDQLNDGIRYFDFRVQEVEHRNCADPTVFRIKHGIYWGPELRFNSILISIRTWLMNSMHNKEVIILDLQQVDLRYDDPRASLVLLATIQQELGTWIHPFDAFLTNKLSALSLPRVIVLMQRDTLLQIDNAIALYWNYPEEIKHDCSVDIKGLGDETTGFIGNIGERDMILNSYYGERKDPFQLRSDIDYQLQREQYKHNLLFNRYRTYQSNGLLNVLQIVFRPSNWWYACAFIGVCNLMEYAHTYNGYFSVVPEKNCYGGWLGKRLWMAINATGDRVEYWNRPNILIIDNYANGGDWVSAYYENDKWHKEGVLGYVDFIKSINKNSHAYPMTYTPTLEDECLP